VRLVRVRILVWDVELGGKLVGWKDGKDASVWHGMAWHGNGNGNGNGMQCG